MTSNNSVLYAALTLLMTIVMIATTGFASDLAIYSGPSNPGWVSAAAVAQNADTVQNDPAIKGIFKNIENFGDGDEKGDSSPLAKWLVAHTENGEQDVIFLACGTTPSALYPFPNKEPDGSNVENFVEAGNVVINVGDWIFYMSYEGGVRSAENGPTGAANVFNIPGLTFGARNGAMKPTDAGKKYLPKSLQPFNSDRPWHVEQFDGSDWDLVIFAQADQNNADPAVAINKNPGKDGTPMIAAMWQAAQPVWAGDDPRGTGVVEFISNWLTENGNLSLAVDAKDKMTTTWGKIRKMR